MDNFTLLVMGISVAAVVLFGFAVWQFITPKNAAAERLAEFTGGPDRAEFPTRLSSLTRSAALLASGSETGPVVLGGLRVAGDTVSAGAEVRYQSAAADLGVRFAGLELEPRIDLGGWIYQFTVGVRFGR